MQKIRPNFKIKKPQFVGSQYYVLAFFWLVFIVMLITMLILFTTERSIVDQKYNVSDKLISLSNTADIVERNKIYQQLLAIQYPIIDFSMLTFVFLGNSNQTVIADYQAAYNQRISNINIAYSYIFITALIALIAFVFYFVTIVKITRQSHFERRYQLSTKFPNLYPIFSTKMYLNFTVNLAIIFAFFNFLTTITVIIYGIFLVLVSYFFWYILKVKSEILVPHKWWKSSNFVLFTSILLIQNGYNIVKLYFSNKFGVNLDLILSILFPIGTITVMITLLIRNLLNSQVSAVKAAIKTINSRVSAFRVFYYTRGKESLDDFTFVSQLPTLIKQPLQNNSINETQAFKLMTIINEASTFFEQHFKNAKERNYMLYHLFNEIVSTDEINEIKANILKLEESKK